MSNLEENGKIPPISELNGNVNNDKPRKEWVKFEEDSPLSAVPLSEISPQAAATVVPSTSESTSSTLPAVLKTESVYVNIERGDKTAEIAPQPTLTKNVEFVNIRTGFDDANKAVTNDAVGATLLDTDDDDLNKQHEVGATLVDTVQHNGNGDIIVTILPSNTKWPWVTAARFRPELVPEELMAQGLTLTVEEYVHAMELLVNDARFTLYNICYKRVLVCWVTLAFLVLLALLFSGLTGLLLFSLGVLWLVLNAAAIFLCMWVKLTLSKGLEQCLASVNKLLNKHKLILALDDRGKISCHKVNLCFIYFDSGPCVAHVQQFIESEEGKSIMQGWEQRLDVSANDIVIQGSQSTRLSRKQGMAEQVYLRYLQRWGKDFLRRRLDWTLDEEGGNPAAPRHLTQALCPCQYVEEILRNKEPRDSRACCPACNTWLRRRGLD